MPWVTTLTDPFQMMYHEVPLSPWLNTERSADQTPGVTCTSPWPLLRPDPWRPASCPPPPPSDLHTVPALLCGSKSRTAANSRFTCEAGNRGSVGRVRGKRGQASGEVRSKDTNARGGGAVCAQ